MADLVEDFLDEAALRLSDLEGLLNVLKNDPTEEEGWESLRSFFSFVRSVSPFIGFNRSYRLSEAAMREIDNYRKREKGVDVLPDVLIKLQRVRKIIATAGNLKRESRESDDDILPIPEKSAGYVSVLSVEKEKNAGISEQETALDKREEELVVWAQALAEQENTLKRKENIVSEAEQIQSVSQKKVEEALDRLNAQEKVCSELEDDLAETRQALQACREKLDFHAEEQQRTERLLETKENALNDMGRTIQDLKRLLDERDHSARERESQIMLELQKKNEQAEKLQVSLNMLQGKRSEVQENNKKFFSQYLELEKEYQNNLFLLKKEQEYKERLLTEKQELENQHLEFNNRMVVLQEKLNVEKEKLKQTELMLEQQKHNGEVVQSELNAAGWPYDTETLQKELAVLARQKFAGEAAASLVAMNDLIAKIRTHSFIRIPHFFMSMAQTTAQQYRRVYDLSVSCDVRGGVDKDALSVLKQVLVQLTDNAFNHAYPKDNGTLFLTFTAKEKGAYIHCSFSDNGSVFDFDRLSNIVRIAGIVSGKDPLPRPELMAYLFHNAVRFKNSERGLIKVVSMIEKSGGQVAVDFNNGMQIDFSIPKRFLFDRVLLFQMAGQLLAVPLNAVAETVFLKQEEIRTDSETQETFFYWKGEALPVLNLDSVGRAAFGLVIQAGVFRFFIPVQQISETEHIIAFSDQSADDAAPYLTPCTVLESGREVMWLDLAELLRKIELPLPRKIVSLPDQKAVAEKKTSYLIFKSEPSIFGAVRADDVLRVEDFTLSAKDLIHKKLLETQDGFLPLKDSCPRDGYPHAQAVLIFKTFALAIHEVADIIEMSSSDSDSDKTDFIVYHNKKVPVFTPDA